MKASTGNAVTPYEQRYAGTDCYWGTQPSGLCDQLLSILQPMETRRSLLLDIGCGEGRNAIYLARRGFRVVGLDLSASGLEKTRRYAEEAGLKVETIHADINTWEIDRQYDVIFSTGTLHYLAPDVRAAKMEEYKQAISPDGLHAMSTLVAKPFLACAPDAEHAVSFKSGELMGYYWDWDILLTTERIFDCLSSGIPHQHACNWVIAQPRQYKG